MLAEWRAFQAILIMAPLQRERGRVLWNKHDTTKPRKMNINIQRWNPPFTAIPEGTRGPTVPSRYMQ